MSDFELAIESTEEIMDYEVLVSKFKKSEQRRLVHDEEIIGWRLKSPALTQTQALEYRNHFKSVYGPYDDFTWTNRIDDVEYTVRYTENSFRIVREEGHYRATWEFTRIV